MTWLYVLGGVLALGIGIYVGLGAPGIPGAEDRVLPPGQRRRRRRMFTPFDLFRPRERPPRARTGLLR
ncbi:MAG: hypothetical protein HY701_13190 [Gemmatimonadetes bacterium]|nr:hypothetical protein [Gemmatimonadota bacterium]